MPIISRAVVAVATMAGIATAALPARAQLRADSGTFVVRLGRDTLKVERFVLRDGVLRSESVRRGAGVELQRVDATLNADGSVARAEAWLYSWPVDPVARPSGGALIYVQGDSTIIERIRPSVETRSGRIRRDRPVEQRLAHRSQSGDAFHDGPGARVRELGGARGSVHDIHSPDGIGMDAHHQSANRSVGHGIRRQPRPRPRSDANEGPRRARGEVRDRRRAPRRRRRYSAVVGHHGGVRRVRRPVRRSACSRDIQTSRSSAGSRRRSPDFEPPGPAPPGQNANGGATDQARSGLEAERDRSGIGFSPFSLDHSFHGIAGTAALCLNGPAASIAQPLGLSLIHI